MGLLRRLKEKRAAKKEDRDAIAAASREFVRVGDEPVKSQTEIVSDAIENLPPMN